MTHYTARNCFVDAAENGPFNVKLAELKLCGGVTAFLADLEAVCPKGKDEEDKVFGFVVIEEGVAIDGKKFLALGEPGGAGLQVQVIETRLQADLSERKKDEGIVDFIVEVTDVYACCKKVVDFGLFLRREPVKAPYGITAIFEDPFGNLWDLVQRSTPK